MRRVIALMALVATLTAAPSQAQVKGQTKVSKDEARIVMRDFTQCLVRSASAARARDIDAFLAMSPASADASKLGGRLATADCLSSRYPASYIASLRMPPMILRGALFRARFERRFAKAPIGTFAPYDVNAAWHLPVEDGFAIYQAIGECTVRGDPANSRAVLDLDIGSKAEEAAFQALIPTLQNCMPRTGTYRFSRAVLESVLAEAWYHLSVNAAAPAPAVEGK